MRTTEYLYGIKPSELDSHTYWSGLNFKIKEGTNLFRELYKSKEDNERLFWVNKAIEHTRKLINERDDSAEKDLYKM